MVTPYRLGLIGLGRVAWLLEQDRLRAKPCTHLGAWLERADVKLAAVCDSNPARLEAFSAQFPGVPVYLDYSRMLTEEPVDLLSVCAYATERCDMVVSAARSDVRGIWCEKAMATSLDEALRMEAALAERGTAMVVAFMRRWAPAYAEVKRLLQEGAIGRLESINVHFPSNMLHTGTHAFDVLRLWSGEIETVQAWLDSDSAQPEQSGYRFGEQAAGSDWGGFAVMTSAAGVRTTVHAQDKNYFRFEFELLGSDGLIRIGNTQRELWRVARSPRFTGFREIEQVPFPKVAGGNAWRAAADNLVAAVEGRSVSACDATDGRQALAIGLAMHISHREGNRPVQLHEVPPSFRVLSR